MFSGNAHYFNECSTELLLGMWREQFGSTDWLEDMETALKNRGFVTRNPDGTIAKNATPSDRFTDGETVLK